MFLAKGNIDILWEIIREQLPSINQQLFIKYIHLFEEREKSSGKTLYQLNTTFITTIIKDMEMKQQQQQQQQQDQGPIKLKIQDTPTNYSITAEELHTERMDSFSKEFNKKQNEFTSMMTLNKPAVPNFTDTSGQDEPKIGAEMENLIAQTLAQRNFDIEQIHSSQSNQVVNLKGKETHELSVKESVDLTKHITWSNNIESFFDENSSSSTNELADFSLPKKTDSIFSKLKTIKPIDEDIKEIKDKLNKIMLHLNIQ
jgi:hypothetical protein